jgi:hypothetical protein
MQQACRCAERLSSPGIACCPLTFSSSGPPSGPAGRYLSRKIPTDSADEAFWGVAQVDSLQPALAEKGHECLFPPSPTSATSPNSWGKALRHFFEST